MRPGKVQPPFTAWPFLRPRRDTCLAYGSRMSAFRIFLRSLGSAGATANARAACLERSRLLRSVDARLRAIEVEVPAEQTVAA